MGWITTTQLAYVSGVAIALVGLIIVGMIVNIEKLPPK